MQTAILTEIVPVNTAMKSTVKLTAVGMGDYTWSTEAIRDTDDTTVLVGFDDGTYRLYMVPKMIGAIDFASVVNRVEMVMRSGKTPRMMSLDFE